MGKQQKKTEDDGPAAPTTGLANLAPSTLGKRTGLSLDLGGLLPAGGKRLRTSALQPKQLINEQGAPTLEGMKLQFDNLVQELAARVDKNQAALVNKLSDEEAGIHKQAKADHAKTCQMLQDSQAAIDLAGKQHQQALKQVSTVAKATLAAVEGAAKAASASVKEVQAGLDKQLAALRSKAGLK